MKKSIDNLAEATADMGVSNSLKQKLVAAENESGADRWSAKAHEATAAPIDRAEVREFVEKEISNLADILLADPVTAKNELRKYISGLVLTPFGEGRERGYIISGDIALFQTGMNDVMQEDSMERKPLHYIIAIRLRIQGR